MQHAYVYYRIDLTQANLATTRIDALLLLMGPHCGLPPHRMQRCDDASTWMEVYPEITDFGCFSAALNAAIQTLDCTAFILSERHLECFSSPA